jgi:hypothetical protein
MNDSPCGGHAQELDEEKWKPVFRPHPALNTKNRSRSCFWLESLQKHEPDPTGRNLEERRRKRVSACNGTAPDPREKMAAASLTACI